MPGIGLAGPQDRAETEVVMAWVKTRNGKFTGMYRDAKGRERSAGTSTSKRAALRAAETEEAKVRTGEWLDPDDGRITFATYFTDHWLPHRRGEVNTLSFYEGMYRAKDHGLEVTFGDMALVDIRPSVIDNWVTDMVAAGMTPSTIRSRFKALQTVLAARRGTSALRDKRIAGNPCAAVDLPFVPQREVTIYTPEESDKLIEALHPWYQLQVLFAVETGCRMGEVRGLRVSDVDFLRRVVTVRQTVVETTIAKAGNGTPFIIKEYPKGRRQREVGIDTDLVTSLSAHIQKRGLKRDDLVFASPQRGPRPKREIIQEVERTDVWPQGVPQAKREFADEWLKAIKAAGVPYRRPHDLRASHISWLLAGGADVITVMERAGHNQISTTRRYATTLPDTHDKALAALRAVRNRESG
jgi:integrase